MNVVISGTGAICALGQDTESLWEAIDKGECGISEINRFDVTPFDTHLGGMISLGDDIETGESRLLTYAERAATEALDKSKITNRDRVSLAIGTSNGLMGEKIYNLSYDLKDGLNLGGLVITFSTACTSSAHALGFAADLIKGGYADYVLAGGADILTLDVFAGFYSLGLLSGKPCAPFSSNLGTTLGEGAAFFLLESNDSAEQRGVKPLASFMGYGISSDAFHDTKPDPNGTGISKAIQFALNNSLLEPQDIDYINAHGTATAANDSAEWLGIQRSFGKNAITMPVSSSKSFLGHAQGAAGVLEALTTLISMDHDVIPPTLNYTRPRPISPNDPVAFGKPRPQQVKYAMCTNAGFGGINSALIFGKVNGRNQNEQKSIKPISIAGYGINTDPDHIDKYIPQSELRGLDLSAKLLAGSVAMALTNAGIGFRSEVCERIGLFVGQERVSPESVEALDNSIKERGIKHLSASAFTRMVVNYSTGVSCRLFGLKGPSATMAAKPDSGFTALLCALNFLITRRDTDHLIVAAVQEGENDNKDNSGAISILLKLGDETLPDNISGWSFATDTSTANQMAMNMAGLGHTGFSKNEDTYPHISAGLMSLIDVIENGKNSKPILICTHANDPMGMAVILERRLRNAG